MKAIFFRVFPSFTDAFFYLLGCKSTTTTRYHCYKPRMSHIGADLKRCRISLSLSAPVIFFISLFPPANRAFI